MCPISFVYGFMPNMIKFCMMHTLHLGLLHVLNGASLTLLHEHAWFGESSSVKDMLGLLTLRFRKWCSVQGIRPFVVEKKCCTHLLDICIYIYIHGLVCGQAPMYTYVIIYKSWVFHIFGMHVFLEKKIVAL